MTIKESISDFETNPQLFKKYEKKDFMDLFESLIIEGDIFKLDSFLALPFPKSKAVGVHLWDNKSNSFSFYESYINLALTHRRKNVFNYFYSQKEFSTSTILDRMCSTNHIEMIDFILTDYPPDNVSERDYLLNSAINDNYVEQFRLLATHHKNPINFNLNNYELLKKSCIDGKDDFVAVLMIDCNLQLDQSITDWLAGDNADDKVYTLPHKIETLRALNQKLKNLPSKENSTIMKEKKLKI